MHRGAGCGQQALSAGGRGRRRRRPRQSTLARLAFWDAVECEVGQDSAFGGTGRRLEYHLLVALVRAAPPQSGLPEALNEVLR
jgi:hypothetical protein